MVKGSSPRMRGARQKSPWASRSAGLIPAHAGSTPRASARRRPWRAHPRACGEHSSRARWASFEGGSSPRMRGAREKASSESTLRRLIPAHAGSTHSPRPRNHPQRAHPRACGEHGSLFSTRGSSLGSSPRMRGAPELRPARHVPPRLIPAHAGSTCSRRWGGIGRRAHPRACGEHSRFLPWCVRTLGSSPRMRGAPCVRL